MRVRVVRLEEDTLASDGFEYGRGRVLGDVGSFMKKKKPDED